jgi:VWFA-related protein
MPRIHWACLVFCVTVWAGVAAAQTPATDGQNPPLVPRTPAQREQTYVAQRRINLHVAVTDASGKPVAGLKPDDFTVLDHDQPQKIALFQEVSGATVADAYVHGVVVLDAINGGSGGVNRVRKELAKLLGQGHEPLAYPLEIVVASETGNNEGKPATDRGDLIKDLNELTRNVHSTDCYATQPGSDLQNSRIGAEFLGQMDSAQVRWNCLNSHFTDSLNALKLVAQEQQNEKGRAIVIWTGPGWPLPPKMGTGQVMGGGTMGDLSDAIFSVEADMQQAQVTLEAVSWGKFERAQGIRRAGLQGSLKGASLEEQEAAIELSSLAEESGGLVLEKSKNLADALSDALADGEQFYSFAFDPPSANTQDEWRSITVKVDRPGATVRTLTGYYTQP